MLSLPNLRRLCEFPCASWNALKLALLALRQLFDWIWRPVDIQWGQYYNWMRNSLLITLQWCAEMYYCKYVTSWIILYELWITIEIVFASFIIWYNIWKSLLFSISVVLFPILGGSHPEFKKQKKQIQYTVWNWLLNIKKMIFMSGYV